MMKSVLLALLMVLPYSALVAVVTYAIGGLIPALALTIPTIILMTWATTWFGYQTNPPSS